MESTTTLALLGIWFLGIAVVLGFFAGARRMSDASRTNTYRSSLSSENKANSLRPPTRETA